MSAKQKLTSILLLSFGLLFSKLCFCAENPQLTSTNGVLNCSATSTAANATSNCPPNSLCSAESIANETAYHCKCLTNYELNPSYNNSNSTNSTAYCLQVDNRIYIRQPAKVEHLAFGILLVLFVVIAAVVLLYLLKISRPIKRSKAAYTRLKRRREHRQRLEEFNEDDISMIQLNENLKH